jgi:hypothetical protein
MMHQRNQQPQPFNGANLYTNVLISILNRQDQQMTAINALTEKVDALATTGGQPNQKQQYISTALALIIFAMLVLAVALKGCG